MRCPPPVRPSIVPFMRVRPTACPCIWAPLLSDLSARRGAHHRRPLYSPFPQSVGVVKPDWSAEGPAGLWWDNEDIGGFREPAQPYQSFVGGGVRPSHLSECVSETDAIGLVLAKAPQR